MQSNADNAQSSRPPFSSVDCEGTYRSHLQGICTNEVDAIYWSFTRTLVKTDRDGNVRTKVEVPRHYGDLCFCDGAIHVAVNFGRFNDPEGNADRDLPQRNRRRKNHGEEKARDQEALVDLVLANHREGHLDVATEHRAEVSEGDESFVAVTEAKRSEGGVDPG